MKQLSIPEPIYIDSRTNKGFFKKKIGVNVYPAPSPKWPNDAPVPTHNHYLKAQYSNGPIVLVFKNIFYVPNLKNKLRFSLYYL